MRAPAAGRNWEGFGSDPHLAGEGTLLHLIARCLIRVKRRTAAYHTIRGVQSQGVQACAKHFLGNEQEHFRTTSSSNIDDRTFREVYLHRKPPPLIHCYRY